MKSLWYKLNRQAAWSSVIEGKIGRNTRVWRWSHISKGAIIGDDCMIGANVYIGPNVIIGNNTRIQNGVFIPEGWHVADNVFIGPNTTFVNHKSMVGGKEEWEEGWVDSGCKIGAMCTIFPCILNKNSIVGARTLVIYTTVCDSTIHERISYERNFGF